MAYMVYLHFRPELILIKWKIIQNAFDIRFFLLKIIMLYGVMTSKRRSLRKENCHQFRRCHPEVFCVVKLEGLENLRLKK